LFANAGSFQAHTSDRTAAALSLYFVKSAWPKAATAVMVARVKTKQVRNGWFMEEY
jgi:hypothetical protein